MNKISNQLSLRKAAITGIGVCLPPRIVTSEELMLEAESAKFGVHEKFLGRATGILERRFSTEQESYGYLAIQASLEAIKDARIDPKDIDLVLFCGIDRDKPEPSTAHEVQAVIGAVNAVCLDISNACIGMLNGFSIAEAYISAGKAENILLCTGEKISKLSYDSIRRLKKSRDKELFRKLLGSFTLGDGGGAFIVSPAKEGKGCEYMKFVSDGSFRDLCYYQYVDDGIEFVMKMEEISHQMVIEHQNLINETYKATGWSPEMVDKLFCHQVGKKPHQKLIEFARVDVDKAPVTYNRFGNLTSATFAVNMYFNRPREGEKILFFGAGSGATVCQAAFQF